MTGARVYPIYPVYPPVEGADPLQVLLPLCSTPPPPMCPDCDVEEELTPSGFIFACRACHPQTFTPRA